MKILLTMILILLTSSLLHAEEGLFLDSMMVGEIPAIERALIGRKWKVVQKSETRISAEMGRKTRTEITIFYKDGGFYYSVTKARRVPIRTICGGRCKPAFDIGTNLQRRGVSSTAYKWMELRGGIPERWLEYLRSDTLLSRPLLRPLLRPSSSERTNESIKSRLEKIDSLHKEGIIADDEYENLRMEILRSI